MPNTSHEKLTALLLGAELASSAADFVGLQEGWLEEFKQQNELLHTLVGLSLAAYAGRETDWRGVLEGVSYDAEYRWHRAPQLEVCMSRAEALLPDGFCGHSDPFPREVEFLLMFASHLTVQGRAAWFDEIVLGRRILCELIMRLIGAALRAAADIEKGQSSRDLDEWVAELTLVEAGLGSQGMVKLVVDYIDTLPKRPIAG